MPGTRRESRSLDFKERFDPASAMEWCEAIKDIVAMANTNGGEIIVGIDDDGEFSGFDPTALLRLDQAVLVDKLGKYIDSGFDDVEIHEATEEGHRLAVIRVGAADPPIVFVKPGTYEIEAGKQRTAFSKGTVYFRHGAKSEPGTSRDIERAINSRVSHVRREWMRNIKKVVAAPAGSTMVVPLGTNASGLESMPVHVVNDPNAPAVAQLNPNATHPHRQKDIIERVNELPGIHINTFDLLAVRRLFGVSDEAKPEWAFKPRFGSAQYNDAFADWLIDKAREDSQFFETARQHYREQRSHPSNEV